MEIISRKRESSHVLGSLNSLIRRFAWEIIKFSQTKCSYFTGAARNDFLNLWLIRQFSTINCQKVVKRADRIFFKLLKKFKNLQLNQEKINQNYLNGQMITTSLVSS